MRNKITKMHKSNRFG